MCVCLGQVVLMAIEGFHFLHASLLFTEWLQTDRPEGKVQRPFTWDSVLVCARDRECVRLFTRNLHVRVSVCIWLSTSVYCINMSSMCWWYVLIRGSSNYGVSWLCRHPPKKWIKKSSCCIIPTYSVKTSFVRELVIFTFTQRELTVKFHWRTLERRLLFSKAGHY